jgi:PAS domain S-box-containing protein
VFDWLTESFSRVTGYDFNDRERFQDNPSIYHPDDQQLVLDDIERVKQCETVTGEYRIVKPDGKIRLLEITRRPVWDETEGRVVKFFGAAQDITERKKAEDALKQSEERYRLLAENSSDMISLHEPAGEFVYVSPAIEKLLGYKADTMIGVNPYTLFHPDDIERIRKESHEQALQGVTRNRVEYRMKTASGDYTWLESATQPIIEDGEVVGLVSVTGDINERKHAEATLRDSESRLAGIIQSAMDAIITIDEDQQILLFNPTAEKMFQYTAADVMGLSLDRLIPKRFHKQHVKHIEKFGRTGISNREMGALTPISGLRAGGEEFPIEASISQVTVGEHKYFTVILRDITERQQAEAAIQDSENRFRSTFEQAAVGISHVSIEGKFIRLNQRFCDIVGYSHEELIQLTYQEITHPDDLEADIKYHKQVLEGEIENFTIEKRYIRKNETSVWINLTISLMREETGEPKHFIAVIEDISDRKLLEQELRRLNTELEERVEQRTAHLTAVNQELEAFSYSVSHDLRAPLRSIDGFSLALLEDYADKVDADGQDYLNRIRASSQRMGQLIDDMIELSRINRGDIHYDTVNLSQLAQDVIASLQERDPSRDIAISIQDEMVTRGDSRLLRVLLENLLGNSWKFTSKEANAQIEFGLTTHDGEPT